MKSRSRDGLAAKGLLFHYRLLDMRLVIVNSYPTRARGLIVKEPIENIPPSVVAAAAVVFNGVLSAKSVAALQVYVFSIF